MIKVMQYSFQTVRFIYMPSAMRGSSKYEKENQFAQILSSCSSAGPLPCNYSFLMECVYRSESNTCC